jgi:CheY-like chemotaxis protein
LVIDDNSNTLDMLRIILEKRGRHEAILAAEGKDGLDLARSTHPDLAIVDVMMPDMDGYTVVRELRGSPETAELPILILTARGQAVDKMVALQVGADAHIAKPVQTETLLTKIDELLQKSQENRKAVPLPILSLHGGSGATTVAVNLALLLQKVGPTVLLDLSPNSGHCSLYLGMKPEKHWRPLLNEDTTIQPAVVQDLLLEHPSGLRLLAAPPTPVEKGGLNTGQLKQLLEIVRQGNAFLVVDMPPGLSPATKYLLSEAPHVLLVTRDDPAGIQTTRQTLQALGQTARQARVILNHVTPGPHPRPEAVQRAVRAPLVALLPYEADHMAAARRSTPLALCKPSSKAIFALGKVVQYVSK